MDLNGDKIIDNVSMIYNAQISDLTKKIAILIEEKNILIEEINEIKNQDKNE